MEYNATNKTTDDDGAVDAAPLQLDMANCLVFFWWFSSADLVEFHKEYDGMSSPLPFSSVTG